MTLICCIDDNMGMQFNKRRQSKDRLVSEDMLKRTSGHTLWVEPKSEELFIDGGVQVKEHCMETAAPEDFCFIEDPEEILAHADKIDRIMFYAWNRVYPSDKWFPMPVMKDWHLEQVDEFHGYSHEKITVCIYTKKGSKTNETV